MTVIRRLIVRWRRWRLRRTYSRLVACRDGMDGAFTGILATWREMERDGVIEFVEGEVRWRWP